MRNRFPQMLGAALLVTAALPATAQDTEIKGARITLETTPIAVEVLTLENQRNSSLVAWQIAFVKDGKPDRIHTTNYTWQPVVSRASGGPIPPHGRRTIELHDWHSPANGSPVVRLVVFEDGYIEGISDAVEEWQRHERARADDAAYWLRALDAIPTGNDAVLKSHLEGTIGERAAQAPDDASGLRGRLANVLRVSSERLVERIRPIRDDAAWIYDGITRRPPARYSLEHGAPVVLTSKRETKAQYAAVITNLRDVAIEAFGFELLDPLDGRPTGGQTSDYCGTEAGSETGKIAAKSSRQIRLYKIVEDASKAPLPRLTFVMFDDLVHEGDGVRRAEILTYRERHADDIAYALSVRKEAASRPSSIVLEFIQAKRFERAKALGIDSSHARLFELDELIRDAEGGPERLRNAARVQYLETRRADLLRHQKR